LRNALMIVEHEPAASVMYAAFYVIILLSLVVA
jgi:hypothetical protein